ncbi:MAG: ABC transporter permease [Alphaproteobacteria bacterium]|nr:ABC transporter permease [Alphaproteobacteria bacterium]
MRARRAEILVPALVLAGFLSLWEIAAAAGWLRPIQFPPPSRLARSFVDLVVTGFPQGITLWAHAGITIQRILAGHLLAVALAVPLGLAIGSRPLLDRMTAPIVAFCRSVATLSLLPLAIVWFGTGEGAKIFLIGYGCFWVMLSSTIAAVKLVDPVLIRAARTMDVEAAALFRQVVLPAALPRLLAGARVALGVGFMVIVGAEMIGTIHGLGSLIMEARTFYRTDITMVGMFCIGAFGLAVTAALARLEARLVPWQARQEAQQR